MKERQKPFGLLLAALVALLGLGWFAMQGTRDGAEAEAGGRALAVERAGKELASLEPVEPSPAVAPRATPEAEDREVAAEQGSEPDALEAPGEAGAVEEWPGDHMPVFVSTPDGRSFTSLGTDLGLDPQPLFAGAFAVHTTLAYPAGELPPHDSTLARFHGTPGRKSYVIGERAIGSLELRSAPPFWATLVYAGAPVATSQVLASDTELRFVLTLEALDARLARASLWVVDAASGAPLAGARATLRADSSARRRADLANRESDGDGRVEFTNVVAGGYELLVEIDGAEHQDFVTFEPGERRDLGTIALSALGPLVVEVVDAEGRASEAHVEVGTHVPGRRSRHVFPHMMRHRADRSGRTEVPRRAGPMVLRASIELGRWNSSEAVQEVRGVRSTHVVVDGREAQVTPIRLTLVAPVDVEVSTPLTDGRWIEVVDAAELVVARGSAPKVRAELVPGPHRARIRDGAGALLRELAFEADGAGQPVVVH